MASPVQCHDSQIFHSYFPQATSQMGTVLSRVRKIVPQSNASPTIVEIAEAIINPLYPQRHQWEDIKFIKAVARVNCDFEAIHKIATFIKTHMPSQLLSLPQELLELITDLMNTWTLVNLSRTCKYTHTIITLEALFKKALISNSGQKWDPYSLDWTRLMRSRLITKRNLREIFFRYSNLYQHHQVDFLHEPALFLPQPNIKFQRPHTWVYTNDDVADFVASIDYPINILSLTNNPMERQFSKYLIDKPCQIKFLEVENLDFFRPGRIHRFFSQKKIERLSIANIEFFKKWLRFHPKASMDHGEPYSIKEIKFFDFNLSSLRSEVIESISLRFPSVSHLIFYHTTSIFDNSRRVLNKCFPNIEIVTLLYSNFNEILAYFSCLTMPKLQILKIEGISQQKEEFIHTFQLCCQLIEKRTHKFSISIEIWEMWENNPQTIIKNFDLEEIYKNYSVRCEVVGDQIILTSKKRLREDSTETDEMRPTKKVKT